MLQLSLNATQLSSFMSVIVDSFGMKFCDTIVVISLIIIHMKKLLDSDWLRAVQFKCNTSAKKCNTGAKSVTPVQITHRNPGF